MAKLFFIRKNILKELRIALKKLIEDRYERGEKVAIKAHLGEYGNLTYIRPPILESIVSQLKELRLKPFIFDTPSWYKGSRYTLEDYKETARKNGFCEVTMGCPIIFSDDNFEVKGIKHYERVGVAKELAEVENMVVVSHVKGHRDAGFGGAIKNLGMGGVDRKTKEIAHTLSHPVLKGECKLCGACVKVCPNNAISLEKGEWVLKETRCYGCNACVYACNFKVLKPKKASLQVFLAEAAACVLSTFSSGKVIYVNVLMDVVTHCDCMPAKAEDFMTYRCPDIGILVGEDICAIEQASLDLIDMATNSKNFFLELNHIDPNHQVKEAEKLGLGKREYELVEVGE